MTRIGRISSLILSVLVVAESKIFTPCELGVELAKSKYNVSFWQIPTWVCLAHHATGYNSSYNELGYVGIFRLSSSHWCKTCNVTCDKLTDDDIQDDINCAVTVYENSHGFPAWGGYYSAYCKEPWKDLQKHDCHKVWKLLVLRYPQYPLSFRNYDSSSPSALELSTDHEEVHLSTTEEPPSEPSGSFANWEAHHVIFSDTGLMIIILTLILIVAGIIEIWRRKELPFSRLCMNA